MFCTFHVRRQWVKLMYCFSTNKRTKALHLHVCLQRFWRHESHVAATNKQQELFRLYITKQVHFKLIEVIPFWLQMPTQFRFNRILVRIIVVLTVYRGGVGGAPRSLILPPNSTSSCSKRSSWFQCSFCICLIKAISLQNVKGPK